MTAAPIGVRSTYRAHPRFEGANINSWIGFKHVMYLLEEAVLAHFRQQGHGPRALFDAHGLGLDIVDSDARILTALHLDDMVRTEVSEMSADGGELVLRAESFVEREGDEPVKAVAATLRVVLRAEDDGADPPPELAGYTVARIDRPATAMNPAPPALPAPDAGAVPGLRDGAGQQPVLMTDGGLMWRWRVPYFYCHYSTRAQHSGYLRLMEEVVDLFLSSRGISIRTMLDRHRWIPVVPRASLSVLGEALMEEELYTVFTVEDVYKNFTYTARMDCYVHRDDRLVPTATGRITHGYAEIRNRRDWRLVEFDPPTAVALRKGLATKRGDGWQRGDG
jgi:acyl-CoA thioesterase FadM